MHLFCVTQLPQPSLTKLHNAFVASMIFGPHIQQRISGHAAQDWLDSCIWEDLILLQFLDNSASLMNPAHVEF